MLLREYYKSIDSHSAEALKDLGLDGPRSSSRLMQVILGDS